MLRYLLPALLVLPAGLARAQFTCAPELDCALFGGCETSTYGLSTPLSQSQPIDPLLEEKVDRGDTDVRLPINGDYTGSFTNGPDDGRPNSGCVDPSVCACGAEDGHLPVFGTFKIKTYAACDPFDDTSPGWGTEGGPGCPVSTDRSELTPTGNPTHFFSTSQTIASQPAIGVFDSDGDMIPDTASTTQLHINVASVGQNCGRGRVIPNPDPEAAADSVRIVWDQQGTESGGGSQICCNSPDAPFNICSNLSGLEVARYPAIPNLAGFGGPYTDFSDWVYTNGLDSDWEVDPDAWILEQRFGVCESNRDVGCDCGIGGACLGDQIVVAADGAFIGNPCPGLDVDDVSAGLQPDRCDVDNFQCEFFTGTACDCTDADPAEPGSQLTGPRACYPPQVAAAPTTDPFFGGNSCPDLDADPDTAGLQPDVCDNTELGWRLAPDSRLDPMNIGSPNPNSCAGAPYKFRGFFNRNCSVSSDHLIDGDPGPDCSVNNYGAEFRPDEDCDGLDDTLEDETCDLAAGVCNNKSTLACTSDAQCAATGDLCPFLTEVGGGLDVDGNGIGDECQCGDANRNGIYDVGDILVMNDLIFNDPGLGTSGIQFTGAFSFLTPQEGSPAGFGARSCPDPSITNPAIQCIESDGYFRLWHPLADATYEKTEPGDPFTGEDFNWDTGGQVAVTDILALNDAIFDVGQPSCARYPRCGDGNIHPTLDAVSVFEECDDGDTDPADGCSPTCEIEVGFTCDDSEPSVCTPL